MGTKFSRPDDRAGVGKSKSSGSAAPEQSHRVSQEGRHLASSNPIELLALLFTRDAASQDERLLREALALSVERGSIRNVLLQGAGQAVGQHSSELDERLRIHLSGGRGFYRGHDTHGKKSTQCQPGLSGFDASDPISRLLAERIALNAAEDAGLSLQPTSAAVADIRLVRIPLEFPDPWIALANVAQLTGTPRDKRILVQVDDLYASRAGAFGDSKNHPSFSFAGCVCCHFDSE